MEKKSWKNKTGVFPLLLQLMGDAQARGGTADTGFGMERVFPRFFNFLGSPSLLSAPEEQKQEAERKGAKEMPD